MLYKTIVILVLAAACSSEQSDPETPAVSPYAGTYATAVALRSSTCSGIGVQPNPTIVTHQAGQSSLGLRHANIDYTGTVDADGTFRTTPKPVNAGNATHTLTISGKFGTRSFAALVSVVVTTPGAADCTYTVDWTGTR